VRARKKEKERREGGRDLAHRNKGGEGGRSRSNVFISYKAPWIADNHQKLEEKCETDPPSEPLAGTSDVDMLTNSESLEL
jgi:hypothetical protein